MSCPVIRIDSRRTAPIPLVLPFLPLLHQKSTLHGGRACLQMSKEDVRSLVGDLATNKLLRCWPLMSSIYRTSPTLIQHIQDISYSYPTYTGHQLLLSNIYRTSPTLIQRIQDITYSYPTYIGHCLLLSNVYRTIPTLIQSIQDFTYSYPTYTGHYLLLSNVYRTSPTLIQRIQDNTYCARYLRVNVRPDYNAI